MRPRPMNPYDFCAAVVAEKGLLPAGDVEAVHARHAGDATLKAALIARRLQCGKEPLANS